MKSEPVRPLPEKTGPSGRIEVVIFLAGIGSMVGASCAITGVIIVDLLEGAELLLRAPNTSSVLGGAALIGGYCGVIVGPLLGLGLLRRVPLGRGILCTAAGTIIGGLIGALDLVGVFAPVSGAFLGALVAGIAVSLHERLSRGSAPSQKVL